MDTVEVTTKTKWTIDVANSQIGFKVKYLKFTNVRGTFKEFDASVYTTGEDFLGAKIDCWLNAASIDSGNEKRDSHLKSADFFDVERFRQINFMSTSFLKGKEVDVYELHGDLAMRGVKKQIQLDVEFGGIMKDPWGIDKALFKIKGKINRKDWGLNWNAVLETGGVLVSEDVWIIGEVLLAKQP